MNKNLIALIGKSGSGKNFLASEYYDTAFKNWYNGNEELPLYHDRKFAGIPKEMIRVMIGENLNLDDPTVKNQFSPVSGMTYRQLLISIGQNFRALYGSNIWSKLLFKDFNKHDKWIITDCRTRDEAKEIHERKGIFIRINRYASFNEWAELSGLTLKRDEATKISKPLFIEALKDMEFDCKELHLSVMCHETETALDNFGCNYTIANYGDEKFLNDFIGIIKEVNKK